MRILPATAVQPRTLAETISGHGLGGDFNIVIERLNRLIPALAAVDRINVEGPSHVAFSSLRISGA